METFLEPHGLLITAVKADPGSAVMYYNWCMSIKDEIGIAKEAIQETFDLSDCNDLLGPFNQLFMPDSAADFTDVLFKSKSYIEKCKEIPQRLFLGKLYAVLSGMNANWKERIKLSEKLAKIIGADKKKQQQFMAWIDGIQDLGKIKYYANAFRCWLVCEIELELLYKIISLLNRLTSYELDYIASFGLDEMKPVDVRMSYLVGEDVFKQVDNSDCYQLTGLGRMLKQNCLNYDEGLNGNERVLSVDNLQKAELVGKTTKKDIDKLFENDRFILNCTLDD